MSNTRQNREVPQFTQLPQPVWGHPESWGKTGSITEWHQHAWGQLSYAASGILQVKTSGASYISPPNYGIWIPSGIEHQVISDDAAEMRSIYIAEGLLTSGAWQQPLVCEISPFFRELLIHFCKNPLDYHPDSKQGRLAQVIIDQLEDLSVVEMELPKPVDKRLLRICDALKKDPSSRLSMEQWGQFAGLSGRSVSRLFVLQTGLTFQQWRQRVRLIHALSLLHNGEAITHIALQCGYDSLSAFNDAFKQQFGCSASQFF